MQPYPHTTYDDRDDVRDRRDEYPQSYQPSAPSGSPPHSASPFAFAPPPLSAAGRPNLPMHHSDPTSSYSYYGGPKPPMMSHNSYPYPSSASMAYRTHSNESSNQRASPQTAALARTPSLSIVPTPSSTHSQPSPSLNSPYPYTRPMDNSYQTSSSPQQRSVYPAQYYVPQAAEMPRSLSYPSYAQPYPSPQYSTNATMPFARHPNAYDPIDVAMRPNIGFSFANRLPLVDRPFKCDECVQSFNRNHDLKRHKRIHLAVKPFGCDKCGKTFSRKDALRRHWLVKGCRGEDGATAPIVPMFPINVSRPPPLSPSSPPGQPGQASPVDAEFPQKYNGPQGSGSVPAPLHTMPLRQSSESQIIVTPDELAAQGVRPIEPTIVAPDSMALEQTMSSTGSQRGSSGSAGEGYFDVGVEADTANGYPTTTTALSSPPTQRAQVSPTSYNMAQTRSYSPSHLGPDGKPVFAMPFNPNSGYPGGTDRLLVPTKMEKQASADGDPTTWQRWHRPSFPFPPPPGVNYNFDPSSPVEVSGSSASQSYSQ